MQQLSRFNRAFICGCRLRIALTSLACRPLSNAWITSRFLHVPSLSSSNLNAIIYKDLIESPHLEPFIIDHEYNNAIQNFLIDELDKYEPDSARVAQLYLKLTDKLSKTSDLYAKYAHLKVMCFYLLETAMWKLNPGEIINALTTMQGGSEPVPEAMRMLSRVVLDTERLSKEPLDATLSLAIVLINRNTPTDSSHSLNTLVGIEVACKLQNGQSLALLESLTDTSIKAHAQSLYIAYTNPILSLSYASTHKSYATSVPLLNSLCTAYVIKPTIDLKANITQLYKSTKPLPLQTYIHLLNTHLFDQQILLSLTTQLRSASPHLLNLFIAQLTHYNHLSFGLSLVNKLLKGGYALDRGSMAGLIGMCGERGLRFNGVHLIDVARMQGYWFELHTVVVKFFLSNDGFDEAVEVFGEYVETCRDMDLGSYALFIEYFLEKKDLEKAKEWVERGRMVGCDQRLVSAVLKYCLASEDMKTLKSISMIMEPSDYVDNQSVAEQLLRMVVKCDDDAFIERFLEGYASKVYVSEEIQMEQIILFARIKNSDAVIRLITTLSGALSERAFIEAVNLFTRVSSVKSDFKDSSNSLVPWKSDSTEERDGLMILCDHAAAHRVPQLPETIQRILSSIVHNSDPDQEVLQRYIEYLISIQSLQSNVSLMLVCVCYFLRDQVLLTRIVKETPYISISDKEFEGGYQALLVSGENTQAHDFLHGMMNAKRLSQRQYSVYLNWIGKYKRKS